MAIPAADLPISNGCGEFIAYKSANNRVEPLTEEVYRKVYDVLLEYSPSSLRFAESPEDWTAKFKRRDDLIQREVKKIDPEIAVSFIPKTLYELMFIHECIEEDLAANQICPMLDSDCQKLVQHEKYGKRIFSGIPNEKLQEVISRFREDQKVRNCWHICYFEDEGDETCDEVKSVAYRINQLAVGKLSNTQGPLDFQTISQLTENELDYLKQYHQKCSEMQEQKLEYPSSCNTPGPTTNFGYENIRGCNRPSGIRDDNDAQIIRNAVALECSELAKRCFLLYRGSNLSHDKPYSSRDANIPYSLTYGTSLFAGSVFDGGAAPFHQMREISKEVAIELTIPNEAFALTIPFEELPSSPFYTPLTHTVCQLFGAGDSFCARSKVWKGVASKPGGFQFGEWRWEHLRSEMEREDLIARIEKYYKSNLVLLK